MKNYNLLYAILALLILPRMIHAQTFTGLVLANQSRNVTSGDFTDLNSIQLRNTGSVNLLFFMANSATAVSTSGYNLAAGSNATVTIAELGGISSGNFINVSTANNPKLVVGSYTASINGVKEMVNYETVNQLVYNFDSIADLSKIPAEEYLQLRPTESREFHKEFLSLNGERIHEIKNLSNTTYLPWMPQPDKTVIDSKGIHVYGKDGKLITEHEQSEMQNKSYLESVDDALKNGFFSAPNFDELLKVDVKTLILNEKGIGYTNGDFIFKNKNSEMRINPQNKHVEMIEYDDNHNEISRFEQNYVKLSDNTYAPSESVEIENKFTSNGLCYKKINYTETRNIKKSGITPKFNPPVEPKDPTVLNQLFGKQITAYPNPTSDVLNISLPQANSAENEQVDIMIKNILGTVVKSLTNQTSGTTVSINVANLQMGPHVIQVIWKNGTSTLTFFKK